MKKSNRTDNRIPEPTIERLCRMYRLLEELELQNHREVSSGDLGYQLDVPAHTVRKDIGTIGNVVSGAGGYSVGNLKEAIGGTFGFTREYKTCIAGIGRLGSALLTFQDFTGQGIKIVAGFDRDINKIELLSSDVPLYPSYEMEERIVELGIELGVIAVPVHAAQIIAERMIAGGVKGIINFAPTAIKTDRPVVIRNIYVIEEFRYLTAKITLNKSTTE